MIEFFRYIADLVRSLIDVYRWSKIFEDYGWVRAQDESMLACRQVTV